MNTELFRKVDDIIGADREKLDMGTWEDNHPSCGTTRCIAGWGIHLTIGGPLYDERWDATPEVLALAEQHGVHIAHEGSVHASVDMEELGAKLFDLSPNERIVFYSDSDTALQFVHLAGQGLHDEARALLNL